jgi:hypothetical protein
MAQSRAVRVGIGAQVGFAVLWLVAALRAAHASILRNADDEAVALSSVAGALPGVIAATLFAGAAVGFLVVVIAPRFVEGLPVGGPPARRAIAGGTGGLAVGLLTLAAILSTFGTNSSIVRLAVTVAVAGLLGGLAAGLPPRVLAAGLAGMSVVLLVGLVFSRQQSWLGDLIGGGDTIAEKAAASTNLAYIQSAVAGLLAGYLAYRVLRPARRIWPWFLLAGALPGLGLLVTEGLTRTGGAALLSIIRGFSPIDEAAVDLYDFSRFRHALIVLFLGGITTMIAVGRTLNHPENPEPVPAPAESSPDGDQAI